MRVAREAQELSHRSLEIARDNQDAGLGDAVDVSLASGAVLDAKAQLLELERDHGVRRAVLQELLGLSAEEAGWSLLGPLPERETVAAPEVLVERALATRLDVAVAERAGTPVVTRVVEGRAAEVEVRLGVRDGAWIQVLAGVAPGDWIATEGGYGLPDGQPVQMNPEVKTAADGNPAGR